MSDVGKLIALPKQSDITESTIQNLRDLVDRCERGDIADVAVVYNDVCTGRLQSFYETKGSAKLLGYLEYLKQRVYNEWT